MTSENENPYIPCIGAVVEPSGEAVHVDCSFNLQSRLYQAFTRFVNNEMMILDKGVYVPDYRIQYYVFAEDISLKEMKLRADEPGALKSFVQKYSGKLAQDIPIQTAFYLHQTSEHLMKHIWPQELRKITDPASKNKIKEEADAYLRRLKEFTENIGAKNRFMVVLETNRGAVVFDDSGYGQIGYHKFMQHLADRFFDPSYKDLKKVRETVITDPSTELAAQAETCRHMFSRLNFRLAPERITFLPSLVKSENKEGTSTYSALGTNIDDLRLLIETYRLKMSEQNLYIKALLKVRDMGFVPCFVTGSILARRFFADEIKHYKNDYPAASPANIPSNESMKADKELKERFGIGIEKQSKKQDRKKVGCKL